MVKAQQNDTISSPINMSHYTKYVQSLLTGGFKVQNVIFKSKFRVKDKTKELRFLTAFIGVFPRRMQGSGKKLYCWWKWIQTVLEVENLKPFSDTHFWTLFTHSCIPLSTLFNVFPLTHKVVHKQGAISTFKTALTMLLILMLKRAGDRMLLCGTPMACLCSLERVELTLTLKEHSDRKSE